MHVAKQAGLSLTWSEILETGFCSKALKVSATTILGDSLSVNMALCGTHFLPWKTVVLVRVLSG